MKVILQEDVPKLGQKDEVKEVSDGYARNYLLPRGLAVEASAGRIQELERLETKKSRQKEKEREAAAELASSLDGKEFTIIAKAGEGGRLFGSVTTADVAKVLQKEGLKVDRKKIEIGEPIKTLGRHAVEIRLHSQVSASIVIVVEQKE